MYVMSAGNILLLNAQDANKFGIALKNARKKIGRHTKMLVFRLNLKPSKWKLSMEKIRLANKCLMSYADTKK